MKSRESAHRSLRVGGAAVVAAVIGALLGGCSFFLGEPIDGLMIPVSNNTDQDLIVRVPGRVGQRSACQGL